MACLRSTSRACFPKTLKNSRSRFCKIIGRLLFPFIKLLLSLCFRLGNPALDFCLNLGAFFRPAFLRAVVKVSVIAFENFHFRSMYLLPLVASAFNHKVSERQIAQKF